MVFGVAELAVLLVLGIPIVAILGGVFLKALKIWKGEGTSQGRKLSAEETRMMQEIHRGLSDLEKRIETLETILLDRTRHDK